ncbi:sensor histidine kinase [Paenibacillus lautus]|uniref:sensor histidine kinase n=1 Tax=Bacillales TaxID=1385 RepID=UPI00203EF91D|nr:sensor histidine kinase [Paenibacillus lautus]MCM3257556.1 sensor histidine kinase [Paenibacillus lautus]
MKFKVWLGNMSLRKKLMVLFAMVGIIPLVVTFAAIYGELRDSIISKQHDAANQNFEQALSLLSAKFTHLEDISSMIMIDEQINEVFSKDPKRMQVWEQLSSFERITDYTRILQTNSEMSSIIYYIHDDFVVAGEGASMYRPIGNVAGLPWVKKIMAAEGDAVWVLAKDEADPSTRYLMLGRVLWNVHDLSKPVGVVTVRIELGRLESYVMNTSAGQIIYLETDDGEVVISSGQDGMEFRVQPLVSSISRDRLEPMTAEDSEYLVRDSHVGSSNLLLRSVLSADAAAQAVNQARNQVLVVYGAVCLALLICIIPVTKSVTRRIFLLMNKMSQVRQGRLNTLDIATQEDEVGHLVSSYNYMINSVKELMDNQYRLGQEKKGAELKALQSQINPHFLYNTLDMILWMAQKDEKENIQQVVYALSDYYKLILNKGEDFVPLMDELRLCEMYAAIQQKRFKGKIRFEIEVEAEAEACLLPKITLQPIVENAIIHGVLEKKEAEGLILIKGSVRSGRLQLSVSDDGPGMREEASRSEPYRGSGYGLHNIRKRLEYYFNEADGFRLHSVQGTGTTVSIDVPAITEDLRSSHLLESG